MIRVFARKTNMTPTDDLAFFDEPPLWDLPNVPVYVSCTFTWDLERAKRLSWSWAQRTKHVLRGGPAFGQRSGEFVPGRFLKEGITITSRGCPKKCAWCLVPFSELGPEELAIKPGYIIQDDNLLACTVKHIETVFDMLKWQSAPIEFKGGLDIDYLKTWHIELLRKIKVGELWVSCDNEAALSRMEKARDLFADFSIEQRRCYVLIGYEGDTVDDARRRIEAVYDEERGFLPQAMYHRRPTSRKRAVPRQWHELNRKWSRPALYRPRKNVKTEKTLFNNQ